MIDSDSSNTEHDLAAYAKDALIVAGGVFIAFKIVKVLTKSKPKKQEVYHIVNAETGDTDTTRKIVIKKPKSNFFSIFDALKVEVGAVLASLLREKVTEYLSQFDQKSLSKDEEENT